MAERDASKSRKPAGRAATAVAPGDTASVAAGDAGHQAVVAERDRLRVELDTALERVQALEAERRQLADRVAWAIDTLQALLDESEAA